MDVTAIDIHELLPQREPFVMVGRLEHFDMTRTVTATTVTAGNPLADGDRLSAAGVLENIAQTCAARIGYVNKYILKRGIQIGYIGAIRNLRLSRLPKTGETLTTAIETVEEIFGMTLVRATVNVGDETIARGDMKIALGNDEAAGHSTAGQPYIE